MNSEAKFKPVVVFDLGAVLIDWNPRHLYRKLFSDEQEMEYFLSEVCSPAWNVRQDGGRSFAEAIGSLVDRYPKYRSMIKAYFERWDEMVPGAIEGTVAILSELKQHDFTLAALSNWSAETYPKAEQRFEFLTWFDEIVLSGRERHVKPQPEIYHILLHRLGCSPQDCIFIDDSTPNVEMAAQLGFSAIHFTTPEQLRKDLVRVHASLSILTDGSTMVAGSV